MSYPSGCPGCGTSARLKEGEAERIIAGYFRGKTPPQCDVEARRRRLLACAVCPDLLYGTTCRHCGCLVEVRSRLADTDCAAPVSRW